MFAALRSSLARMHNHAGGWHTNRKIIVIESDDWGSIRMPSVDVYEALAARGFDVHRCPYARNDTLETAEDLDALYEVLDAVRDSRGRPPVITANTVMANPDFDRIRADEFRVFYYEPFVDTYRRYPGRERVFEKIQEGITRGLYFPQFHGREHVQSRLWLEALREPDSPLRIAFDLGSWAVGPTHAKRNGINLQATFDTDLRADLAAQPQALIDGLRLFESIFGFRPVSFIANNFIYHPDLHTTLHTHGIQFIQGMKYQKLPLLDRQRHPHVRRHQGACIPPGLMNLVRNCTFEPSLNPEHFDTFNTCLRDIASAFYWKRPAIISMHRLNVMGGLNRKNRDRHLTALGQLLARTIRQFPDAEFMTSTELGEAMRQDP
jgi:hypothetical protein